MPKHGVERDVRTGNRSFHETLGMAFPTRHPGTSGGKMRASGLGIRLPEARGLTVILCLCGHPKSQHGSRCRAQVNYGPNIGIGPCSCGEYVKKQ